ncbi:cell division protein FtsA [Campylobacter majalis]|uniref:cell division protein FtsA n=1 Tax=Campylobacter majalis TaxID=2790656 RepID=UPI003D69E577
MSTKILGIDIGSYHVRAVIAEHNDEGLKVIGFGAEKAQGVKKGAITNIELASQSVKNALKNAQMVAGTRYDRVVVSISGANTKSIDSSGVVNVPSHEIGISEIERAMQMADHYANIQSDYEKLHVLPHSFKVDEQENIEDPLGMNGSRLEVQAHIIIAQKSLLSNLRKTINLAGVNIDNIVLSGYASAISSLNDDEKELGVILVDIGSAISDIVIHSGNSIIHNDSLAAGSLYITQDLSYAAKTPLQKAEEIKVNYSSLMQSSANLIEVPLLGDEGKSGEISLDVVSKVIYIRAEEILTMVRDMILEYQKKKNSDFVGIGVVFTGGMTKLEGFKELASMVFDKIQVRIAKPKALEGLYEVMRDPSNSCVIGLCMYGAGCFTPYEIDSEKKMRYKGEHLSKPKINFQNLYSDEVSLKNDNQNFTTTQNGENFGIESRATVDVKDDLLDISDIKHEKQPGKIKMFWEKIVKNMF